MNVSKISVCYSPQPGGDTGHSPIISQPAEPTSERRCLENSNHVYIVVWSLQLGEVFWGVDAGGFNCGFCDGVQFSTRKGMIPVQVRDKL